MLPTGHIYQQVRVVRTAAFVLCYTAYAPTIRVMHQAGNGYPWESWGRKGNEVKKRNATTAAIVRNMRKQIG